MAGKSEAFKELMGVRQDQAQAMDFVPVRAQTEEAVRTSTNQQMLGQLFSNAYTSLAEKVFEKGSPSMKQALKDSSLQQYLG